MMHRASAGGRSSSAERLTIGRAVAGLALSLPFLFLLTAQPAAAQGYEMFPASGLSSTTVTGEKPQSKLWYHDGSWWAILRGADGVAFYEKLGEKWLRGTFVDAVLASSGTADVKWSGERLLVLVYSGSPKYFEFTYDASLRVWNLAPGFPVAVPKPYGAETMVIEQDSSGRAWIAVEGSGSVKVYYTTSADRRTWTTSPVVLRTGIGTDDICSVIAFGGDKIGVFWSDQNRDEFGFAMHRDEDSPDTWQPIEIVDAGAGHADDHIHLAVDSGGRVYAVTKDDFDRMAIHRRGTDGTWTHQRDVTGGIGTRGILMVSDDDDRAYVIWTDWTKSPDRILYRTASLEDLVFGSSTTLLYTPAGRLNNVSGTKQVLPGGSFMAVAEGAGHVWWNGWGSVAPVDLPPPAAPGELVATLQEPSQSVLLQWTPPPNDDPDGYVVYRQRDGGAPERLTAGVLKDSTYSDSQLATGELCYTVTAFANQQEGSASNTACVTWTPPPPGAPLALTATAGEAALAAGAAAYAFDEASGQDILDATGNGHTGLLGSTPGAESADPTRIAGVSGTALRFDGSNDRAVVPDAPALDLAGSLTIEAWVRLSRLGTADCLLAKGETNRRNYWMELDATGRLDFRWETSGGTQHGTQTPAAAIADLEWHHLACVYDREGGENRVYVDGALAHRAPDQGTPVTNPDPLYIGAKTTSGSIKSLLNGDIDQVRLTAGVRYAGDFVPAILFDDALPHAIVQLAWAPPATGPVGAYRVYRQAEDESFVPIGEITAAATEWTDTAPPAIGACYRMAAVDALGREGTPSEIACAASSMAKVSLPGPEVAPVAGLRLAAAPNPFNPTTTIRFRLPEAGRVHCAVYDVRGKRIAVLADEARDAGEHTITWSAAREVPSGVYFLVLEAGIDRLSRKLVLAK